MSDIYPPNFDDKKPPIQTHQEIMAIRRALLFQRLSIAGLIFTILMVIGLVAATVISIRASQVHNAPKVVAAQQSAKSAAETAKRIEDCTTPGRQCYDDGVKRTAQAVNKIAINGIKASAAAASCAAHAHSGQDYQKLYLKIYTCVLKTLSDKHQTPSP